MLTHILRMGVIALFTTVAVSADLDKGYKAFENQQYDVAYENIYPFAKQGDMMAQMVIGTMYQDGMGVDKDYEKSLYWYKKSAVQNNPVAQMALSNVYADKNDMVLSVMWMNVVAQGDTMMAKIAKLGKNKMMKELSPEQQKIAQDMTKKCISSNLNDCDY